MNAQPSNEKFPHETYNTKNKHDKKTNAKICAFAAKNTFGIQTKKISRIWDHGKDAIIAKNNINFV